MNSKYTQINNRKYQRDLCAIALCFVLVILSVHAGAVEGPSAQAPDKVATSVGFSNNPASETNRVVKHNVISSKRIRIERAKTDLPQAKSLQNVALKSFGGDYDIFDADVLVYFDDDFDGHYYGLSVNFDADTDYFSADVYARLYLSYEGGPWEHYYTTEVFTLFGDDADDDYTVETEFYNGYPTGYYDVLIELFDYEYDELVATLDDVDSVELDDVPLEDQQKDGGFIPAALPLSQSHGGGGGSTSAVVVFLLLFTIWRRSIGRREQMAQKISTR